MSNEIAALNRNSMLATLGSLKKTIQESGVPTHRYLSFHAQQAHYYSKDGDKEVTIDTGKELALNWREILHGYICWKDGKPADQVNWNIFEMPTLPPVDSLPDHGPYVVNDDRRDGWIEQITLPLKDLDTGVEYLFKTGPISAVRSVLGFLSELQQELTLRVGSMGEDEEFNVAPMVVLGKNFFVPRGRTNRVHMPKFTLSDAEWKHFSELEFTKVPTPLGQFMSETMNSDGGEKINSSRTIDAEIDDE